MELIFIRHGQGEHLLDYPNRLNTLHPVLTERGIFQVNQLRDQVSILNDDLVIVSPTKRTIQTAELLSNDFFVSPIVGPRMYPQNPDYPSLKCDLIYSRNEIIEFVGEAGIMDFGLVDWEEGINRMNQEQFETYGKQFLEWCLSMRQRVFIISHDGTITNFRLLLGEKGLTRKDFLGEAGVFKINIDC